MVIESLPQALVNGILIGGIYALMAVGLSLIYGVMRIINLAHGALILLGAYLTYWLFKLYGIDPFLSLLITIPALFLLGLILQKVLFSRSTEDPMLSLLITFGLAIVLENSISLIWTADFRSIHPSYAATSWSAGGIIFPITQVGGAIAALVILGLLFLYMMKTDMGRATRATIQNREAAQLVGVNVAFVSLISFGLGAATAAAGGSLLGMMYAFYPSLHYEWIGKLFCVVVLGGLGSILGALVGAVILGLVESLVATYIGASWAPLAAYLILIFILVVRPEGLFGEPERKEVK